MKRTHFILFFILLFGFNNLYSQNDVEAQLQEFLDNGSIKFGKVVRMTFENPLHKFAIKQESTKTPGKFRYLFIDKRVGVYENGKCILLNNTEWTSQKLTSNKETNSQGNDNELANVIASAYLKQIFSSDTKPNRNKSSNSSTDNKLHTCKWCNKTFKGIGFSNDGGNIQAGSGGDQLVGILVGGRELPGDYCSRKCATEAYNNRN